MVNSALEIVGAGCICAAAFVTHVALGLLVLGVFLVATANRPESAKSRPS